MFKCIRPFPFLLVAIAALFEINVSQPALAEPKETTSAGIPAASTKEHVQAEKNNSAISTRSGLPDKSCEIKRPDPVMEQMLSSPHEFKKVTIEDFLSGKSDKLVGVDFRSRRILNKID